MKKTEIVLRITNDNEEIHEHVIFEWDEKEHPISKVLYYPGLEINLNHHRVFKNGSEVYLSRYEYRLLSFMAQYPGKLFTKEQLFEAVWHKDSNSYLRAVSNTIGRIQQKIEDDKDHPHYIKTVSNLGYQFMPKDENIP